MASASGRESFTCPVCLELFEDPRVLPECLHTFCVKCIQGVADSHPGTSFPCPSCREQTTLPPRGATGLRKNLYINSDDLAKARQGIFYCRVHSDQRLDMYCDDCREVLCLKCALTKHSEHKKRNLAEAAADAQSQLKVDKGRLANASDTVESRMRATEKELRAFRDKKAAVEKNIRSRHATVVAAVDKLLEETLTELNETCEALESRLTADLDSEQRNETYLHQLQTQLQDVLDKHIHCSMLDVAKDMRDGLGSTENISKLIPKERETCVRPVLRCNALAAEDMVRHTKDYIGSVHTMEMKVGKSDNTKIERFGITEEPGTEVFSMCVKDNGSLQLSYSWQHLNNTAACEEFNSNGSRTATLGGSRGKVSYKSRGELSMFYTQREGWFITSCKSKEHFSLHNNLTTGKATVKKTIVKSEDPFTAEDQEEFTIQCGPHRAFDVDSSGQYFVIVEESQTSDSERKVRLFNRPQEETTMNESQDSHKRGATASHAGKAKATDITYSPPSQPFKPADVCFYNKQNAKALLIADEINDAIHVVEVRPEVLEFVGYLCPGHPLLVQPTALTVDSRHRLWVACRGRAVLIVEPDMDIFKFRNSYYAMVKSAQRCVQEIVDFGLCGPLDPNQSTNQDGL